MRRLGVEAEQNRPYQAVERIRSGRHREGNLKLRRLARKPPHCSARLSFTLSPAPAPPSRGKAPLFPCPRLVAGEG
jgi:hypothetical protein